MEDALSIAADAVILATLTSKFDQQLTGANQNIVDSLSFLQKSFEKLHGHESDAYVWNVARREFVEAITNLAMKSQTQVGSNTRKTFAEVHHYVRDFVENHAVELLHKNFKEVTKNVPSPKKEAQHHNEEHHHHEEENEEEETKCEEHHHEEATPEDAKEAHEGEKVESGEEGAQEQKHTGRGSRGGRGGRGNRGGYRGGNFRKHNQDEDGFTVVKEEKDNFRGGRGGRGARGGRGGRGSRGGRGAKGEGW